MSSISVPPTITVASAPMDVSRMLQMVYTDLEQQITRADTKAQLILSTNAIILAIVGGTFNSVEQTLQLVSPTVRILIVGIQVMIMVIVLISAALAILAAFPRSGKVPHIAHKLSLVYTEHILSLKSAEYEQRFMDVPLQDLKENIIRELYDKSIVLHGKVANIRRSMTCTLAGIVLWAVLQVCFAILAAFAD